jgi:endonuclease/exonuclease/phosphatase family metal-dependent hydrolase
VGEAKNPGLILIQIDGISRSQLENAIRVGHLPFLARLIERKHFTLETFYSGFPSTTPAVQAEIFYGVRGAVPAFQFLRRGSGNEFRMYEANASAQVEEELHRLCPHPLLEGAHAYSNIYRAGAIQSHYCAQDFAPDVMWSRLNIFKIIILSVAYAPNILRILVLGIIEFGLAVADAIRGLYEREDFMKEFGFVPARVAVCVVLREAIRFRILLDIERGVQLIHANFLGYDEQAHRRGPHSAFAHWTLKGIDRAIRDIYRAANDSRYRDYELMVYSDHGQEHAIPYSRKYGRDLESALRDSFSKGSLAGYPIWIRKMPKLLGNSLDRCRSLLGLQSRNGLLDAAPDPERQIVVMAMGPLGHVYFPKKIEAFELEGYAAGLVSEAGIPLVLLPAADGSAIAFTRRGRWMLPQDRAEVFGRSHAFLDELSEDVVALLSHRDLGDLVISGWNPAAVPLTFVVENGAHGGPGTEETAGFLLVPDRIRRWHVAHLTGTRERVRGEDLRKIVRHYLRKDGIAEERAMIVPAGTAIALRVMTYNIHSCVGIDGKIRPERVARVINHFDPDIVAVQEVDCHRPRSGGDDQAQVIADHLRMSHVFQAMFEEEKERYGIAVFSKYPLTVIKSGYLTDPAGKREARGAIWVEVDLNEQGKIHFINTHFGLGRAEKSRQVDELLSASWLGKIPAEERIVLCGDFNSGPRSEIFRRLQGRLKDAQQELLGSKPRATFSSINPFLRIDHVFLSGQFKVKAIEVPQTPTAKVASDHLPVCVELVIPSR